MRIFVPLLFPKKVAALFFLPSDWNATVDSFAVGILVNRDLLMLSAVEEVFVLVDAMVSSTVSVASGSLATPRKMVANCSQYTSASLFLTFPIISKSIQIAFNRPSLREHCAPIVYIPSVEIIRELGQLEPVARFLEAEAPVSCPFLPETSVTTLISVSRIKNSSGIAIFLYRHSPNYTILFFFFFFFY